MRRLSNTFLTVNKVLAIILMISWFLLAIVFFVMSSMGEFIKEGIESGAIDTDAKDPETAVAIAQGIFIALGVTFVLFGIAAIPSMVLSSKARNSKSIGLFIAVIILSAVSFTEFGIAGGILGIVATKREARSNIIDAQ